MHPLKALKQIQVVKQQIINHSNVPNDYYLSVIYKLNLMVNRLIEEGISIQER